MSKVKTYTAPHAVYIGRRFYKPGEPFVTDEPKGERWEELNKAEKAAIEASDKSGGGDVPLETLSLSALQALAAVKHVNPDGLSKAKLIDAIKAANEPAL